jgi:hypothetical protein
MNKKFCGPQSNAESIPRVQLLQIFGPGISEDLLLIGEAGEYIEGPDLLQQLITNGSIELIQIGRYVFTSEQVLIEIAAQLDQYRESLEPVNDKKNGNSDVIPFPFKGTQDEK